MAKKFDAKAKAKRQKIMIAVGGVILLGLLAFQVPRTMKMLHPQGADSAAATTSSASTDTAGAPLAASLLDGAGATPASAGVSGEGLSDPDSVPTPRSGQLLAFSRFRSKDPFSQQLDLTCGAAAASTEGGTASCGGSAPGSTSTSPAKGKAPATPPSEGAILTPVSPSAPAAPATKPTSATISVNGASESVQVGAQFPASSPTFTLVSLTKTSAKIGIAGGSFESGGGTVTLKKNQPLTLMNTADGTRYVLRLISTS